MIEVKKYWTGDVGERDDFGVSYGDVMYDASTRMGPWACMSEASWAKHGKGSLGRGLGQKYQRQPDGRWLKVEG